MTEKSKSRQELMNETKDLRTRLEAAEDAIRAIRNGEVDAFVITQSDSLHTITLNGADYPYRAIVNSMGEGAVTLIADGTIFFCNSRFVEIVQSTFEKLIGSPFQRLIPQHEQARFGELINIPGKNIARGEFRLQTVQGTYIPVQLSAHILETKDVKGITIVVTDLTERKLAEQERWETEHKLNNRNVLQASILDQVRNAVIATDLDGKIFYWNKFAETLYQWKSEEVIGKPIQEVTIPEDAIGIAEKIIESIQQVGYWEGDFLVSRKDGSYFPAQVLDTLIKNTEGMVIGILGVSIDITERKQAEERLKDSEIRYRRLFEAAQDGVLLLNADTGEIFDVNPYLIKMLGYSYEEFMGKKLWEIGAFKDIVSSQMAFIELREKGYIRYEDLPLRSKDGQLINVEFVSNVYLDDQKKVIQCNVRDISERKRAEEVIRIRTQELKMLFGLSRSLAEAKNLDQVCDIVNQHSVDNVHVTFSRIGLVEGEYLVIRAAYPMRDLDHDLFIGDSKPISALPYCQRVLKGHKAIILHASDPKIGNEERKALLLDHVSSICLVPLRVGKTRDDSGRLLGILMLGEARNESRAPITPQKLSLIGGIGDQASSAIRRMLLREETDRHLGNLSALSKIDRAITSGADLNTSLTTVLEQVVRQLNVDAAEVLLLDSSSQTLVFFCGQGFRTKTLASLRLRLGESHAGRAALERVLVHISNLQDPGNLLVSSRLADENFVGYYAVPLISKGQVVGVLEVFNRTPFQPDDEWLGFLKALAEQASIAIDNSLLFDGLTRSNIELTLAYNDTIEGWSRALDLRDKETEGHTLRVTEKTLVLARSFGLREDELMHFRWGALLHDIGKMGVPDNILLKPGPLTDEEWVLMRKHPTLAYELLSPIHYLRLALDIPYCHHEKWDGTGYPRGLKGEQIPLAARIFAIVDVWDALTSDRPYRPAWTKEKTIEYIQSGSGTHFDPQVVKAFIADMGQNDPITREN